MHIWVIYVYLAKISQKIVEQLENRKDNEMKNRIFGTKDEEKQFNDHLKNFLKRTEEDQLTPPVSN